MLYFTATKSTAELLKVADTALISTSPSPILASTAHHGYKHRYDSNVVFQPSSTTNTRMTATMRKEREGGKEERTFKSGQGGHGWP